MIAVCDPLETNGGAGVRRIRRTFPIAAILGARRIIHAGNHVRGAAKVDHPLAPSGFATGTVVRRRDEGGYRTPSEGARTSHDGGVRGVRSVDLQQVLIEPCELRPPELCVQVAGIKDSNAAKTPAVVRVGAWCNRNQHNPRSPPRRCPGSRWRTFGCLRTSRRRSRTPSLLRIWHDRRRCWPHHFQRGLRCIWYGKLRWLHTADRRARPPTAATAVATTAATGMMRRCGHQGSYTQGQRMPAQRCTRRSRGQFPARSNRPRRVRVQCAQGVALAIGDAEARGRVARNDVVVVSSLVDIEAALAAARHAEVRAAGRRRGRRRRDAVDNPLLADVLQRVPAWVVMPLAGLPSRSLYAVLASTAVVGLAFGPVGIRQRRFGRAPHPRALRRSIGAANPHPIASRSGNQQRVLRCGLHARQQQARRQAGGVGIRPREGVAHQRVVRRGRGAVVVTGCKGAV
eukprot:scaffold21248_cov68-Phaeocystis_antarctica.AAC.3